MRDDLLHAQAAVDWAVSQLPAFAKKISDWLALNVDVGVKDLPPPAAYNPIIAIEKAPLPLAFNVEMGAYVNAIRSSLDILATALAHRHSVPKPEDVYFPVAISEAAFLSGAYKGSKFIKELPPIERGFIEALKPYKGGNTTLWLLHHLDIMRKHRRLIDVEIRPLRITMKGGEPLPADFVPVATGWLRVNEETVLGLIRKGAPDYEMKFVPYVAINEPGLIERKPIIAALHALANHAEFIIGLFDTP
jgi:hypothetical protein